MATELEKELTVRIKKLKRRSERRQKVAAAMGMMQGVLSMLKPGDVVFDCGANIGDVSAQLAGTGATVHAFEPDPYCFERLQDRFGNAENVILHNVAVGTDVGTVNLMRARGFEGNPEGHSVASTIIANGVRTDVDPDSWVEVDIIDLPKRIHKTVKTHGEVAFLKLDIEGAELDLLEEMDRTDLFQDIRFTVAETHEQIFEDLRPRFEALRENFAAKYPATKINLDWI